MNEQEYINYIRIAEAIEYINKHKTPMQKEDLFIKDHVRTRSGQYVNLLDPDPKTLFIEDIAHALAHTPRFGGHLVTFYSVAQHSFLGSIELHKEGYDPKLVFDFLMHDASEAYLVDIPSPLKAHLPEYKKIEHNMMLVLSKKFGFRYPFDPIIKMQDRHMLQREWDSLMIEDAVEPIKPTAPSIVKIQFLNRFNVLKHSI